MSHPDEAPISLADYARMKGISRGKIERDIASGVLPAWKDPILKKRVTSLAAIARIQAAAAAKAEKEYMQRHKLSR